MAYDQVCRHVEAFLSTLSCHFLYILWFLILSKFCIVFFGDLIFWCIFFSGNIFVVFYLTLHVVYIALVFPSVPVIFLFQPQYGLPLSGPIPYSPGNPVPAPVEGQYPWHVSGIVVCVIVSFGLFIGMEKFV